MRKNLVAALVAAVAIAGVAGADYVRVLETYQVKAVHSVIVGENVTEQVAGTIAAADLTLSDDLTVTSDATITGDLVASEIRANAVPTTQVIGAGGTITADACGGMKLLSSAAAVTTDTTNTITAPAAANKGCVMYLVNTNASDAITLDDNALFEGSGVAGATPGDTAIGASDVCAVGSDGSVWRQLGPCSQG